MVMYEKVTIVADTTTTYGYLKRAQLTIPPPIAEESWMLQLNPQGITAYTVNVETT